MGDKKYIAFCLLCGWKSTSKFDDTLRSRLYQHYETEHIDIIMEVWMNNQASENIVDFKEKDLTCFDCGSIKALCDCSRKHSYIAQVNNMDGIADEKMKAIDEFGDAVESLNDDELDEINEAALKALRV